MQRYYNRQRTVVFLLYLALCLALQACGSGSKSAALPPPDKGGGGNPTGQPAKPLDWSKAADTAQAALHTLFWNDYQDYYYQSNAPHDGFNYWWMAHALDVLVDGYLRTNDQKYIDQMTLLMKGIKQKNGQTMHNTFYDDMEWMGLACLRAYNATNDEYYKQLAIQLWDWIKVGWSDVKNGGIAWASGSPNSKNACSNGPAAILAARLYVMDKKQDDLDWSIKIFKWLKEYVVDPNSGLVWDAYGNTKASSIYTYNQGTYIGAAVELYQITGQNGYLIDATRNADYIINDQTKFSPGGILKGENSGDGGLFKGIFIRYLKELTLTKDLKAQKKTAYTDFIIKNATSLLTKATRRPKFIFGTDWAHTPTSTISDCSVELSGIMLLEMAYQIK